MPLEPFYKLSLKAELKTLCIASENGGIINRPFSGNWFGEFGLKLF
jgi:hypothetical protein